MISFLAPRRPLITSIKMKIYSNEEISYYFKIVLLIKDYFHSELPCTFNRYFNKTKMTHTFGGKFYFCQQSELNLLWQRIKKSIIQFHKTWNYLRDTLNIDLLEISRAKAKKLISEHFIETYMDSWSLSKINIFQCYDIYIYTHTHTHIYVYIYMCVCVCICICDVYISVYM